MGISISQLEGYIGAGLNVMIAGPAGTGKTVMVTEAVSRLNWTMKYFSASTLDVFADLIGIPVPDPATKTMEYYRDPSIDTAEVIFFDEVSRAPDQVINSIFEVSQFKSLNGKRLPNLKAVVVAYNPVEEGYEGVNVLDRAFVDRFDIYLESKIEADYKYLKRKYGDVYAKAGMDLFNEYQTSYKSALRSKKNTLGYLSPRRLDKLMEIYKAFPKADTVRSVLPSDVTVSVPSVVASFNTALRPVSPSVTKGREAATRAVQGNASGDLSGLADHQMDLDLMEIRRKSNAAAFNAAYEWCKENSPANAQKLLTKLAQALNYGVGPDTIGTVWIKALRDFTPSQMDIMTNHWPNHKVLKVRAYA